VFVTGTVAGLRAHRHISVPQAYPPTGNKTRARANATQNDGRGSETHQNAAAHATATGRPHPRTPNRQMNRRRIRSLSPDIVKLLGWATKGAEARPQLSDLTGGRRT
jgi:hypothetical protein